MRKRLLSINNKKDGAVTEVLGSMLLLVMAVILFSIVYYSVYTVSPEPPTPAANIAFGVDAHNITLTHCGGKSLDNDTRIILVIDDEIIVTTIGCNFSGWDINNDEKWGIGERLIYSYENPLGKNITVNVVDVDSNSLVMMGTLHQETGFPPALSTKVNAIVPYRQSGSTVQITANGDYRLHEVTLYYRYSADNSSWSAYTVFDNDTSYPWMWMFDFPDGVGYYEFYSIGRYNTNNETPPDEADARCWYVHAPMISDPYPADGATGVPFNPTLHITVTDGDGDLMDITWYTNVSGTWQILGVNNSVGNGTYFMPTSDFDDPLHTYYWNVSVTDGVFTVSSPAYHFTTQSTNTPPDVPSNPSPSNGSTDVERSPLLSVEVNDDDGDTLTVSFYQQNGVLIGSDTVMGSGTASVVWADADQYATTYYWYVVADDGIDQTTSPTWHFTTEAFQDCEDFAGPFPPVGWTQEQSNEWQRSATTWAGGYKPEAKLSRGSISGNLAYLDSKPIDTSHLSSLTLSFRHYIRNGPLTDWYVCTVYTRADSTDEWNVVAQWNMSNTWWDIGSGGSPLEFDISEDIGSGTQVRFEFRGVITCWWHVCNFRSWHIDDVCFNGAG